MSSFSSSRWSLLPFLLLVSLGSTACENNNTLRALPNDAPLAVALIYNEAETSSEQRLGYVVRGEDARLDGSRSLDPDNAASPELLTYVWTFDSVPEGSALTDEDMTVPDDLADTDDLNEASLPTFVPDVLGTYRVRLVVHDDDEAASLPAIVVVQAVPPSQLSLQLEWTETRADLDLHLIGPGGSYFGDGDCFSWNPNPSWGDTDLATDNPLLSSDADGEGEGPYWEIISLETPTDGDYEVWVHYYSDHSAELGSPSVEASPTVEIRVFDQLIWGDELPTPSAPNPMMQGGVWKVGVLSWPDRTWAPLNAESDHGTEGGPAYNTDS